MSTYDDIVAYLKTAADAGSDKLEKLIWGTPGTQLYYPDDTVEDMELNKALDVGSAWAGQVFPPLIEAIAASIDGGGAAGLRMAHCALTTNADGVAPTLQNAVGVSGVTKTSASDYITVSFDPAFDDARYFVWAHFRVEDTPVPTMSWPGNMAAGSTRIYFYDADGVLLDIDGRNVSLTAVGMPA